MKRRGNISYMLFLAVTAAVGGLLFGYDTAVISGTVELVTARFGLDSLQQGWYVGCVLAGSIAGVLPSSRSRLRSFPPVLTLFPSRDANFI